MKESSGSACSPIWLLGDSPPKKWVCELDEPLDSRHPARHNIWTPVLERIQSCIYAKEGDRLFVDHLYVRNAVRDSDDKPHHRTLKWSECLQTQVDILKHCIDEHKPTMVISFGNFAFEFARRSRTENPCYGYSDWSAERMGCEFSKRIESFDPKCINLIPLLHVSIARGQFITCHKNFTQDCKGNYFDYVGKKIATCLMDHKGDFPIYRPHQFT